MKLVIKIASRIWALTIYIAGAMLITLYTLFYSFWVIENLEEAPKKQFFKELVIEN